MIVNLPTYLRVFETTPNKTAIKESRRNIKARITYVYARIQNTNLFYKKWLKAIAHAFQQQ